MATREILPRAGYARQELHWTCPEATSRGTCGNT